MVAALALGVAPMALLACSSVFLQALASQQACLLLQGRKGKPHYFLGC
jgi:hypothetical protein